MAARADLVWITRAEPGASQTADRVRALGREPLAAPLLTVRSLPLPRPDLSGVGALAFTSANAVRAFAELTGERGIPAYAVGRSTADALRSAGFSVSGEGRRGVDGLAEVIASDPGRLRGRVLHPGARKLAGDLVGALRRGGVAADTLTVYETMAVREIPVLAREALIETRIGTVLLHSPRAAQVLSSLIREPDLVNPLGPVHALALSQACIRPLVACVVASRSVAKAPCEEALLALLA